MPSATEIWVTPLACSVCRRTHDDGYECDHWCHDADAETWDDPRGEDGDGGE
jgi:hypothetical protein